MVGMLLTAKVREYVRQLAEAGARIDGGVREGHVKAFDGDVAVFTALQKGSSQPWIVRYTDSPNVKWGSREVASAGG